MKYDYEKDVVSKKDAKESLPLTSDSNPTFPYKSQAHHKPEHYSTPRLKQTQLVGTTVPTTTGENTPCLNVSSPTVNPSLSSSKQNPPSTQEQGKLYTLTLVMGILSLHTPWLFTYKYYFILIVIPIACTYMDCFSFVDV